MERIELGKSESVGFKSAGPELGNLSWRAMCIEGLVD